MAPNLVNSIAIVAVLAVIVGCGENADLDNANDTREPITLGRGADAATNTITFASRTWQLSGPTQNTGDVFRLSMSAIIYTIDEQGIRLLELTNEDDSPINEGVYSRILQVQIKNNDQWVNHGKTAEWMLDGSRAEMEYSNGTLHGTQREWYANGQLHIERQWANGKMNGRDRGWYESGRPQYDVINVDNETTEGKAWAEDGTEL